MFSIKDEGHSWLSGNAEQSKPAPRKTVCCLDLELSGKDGSTGDACDIQLMLANHKNSQAGTGVLLLCHKVWIKVNQFPNVLAYQLNVEKIITVICEIYGCV